MSKISAVFFILFFLSATAFHAEGQHAEVSVSIDAAKMEASVEGHFLDGDERNLPDRLSFILSAIGEPDIASRISKPALYDKDGASIPFKKFGSGDHIAERPIHSWSYIKDMRPGRNARSAAHSSWISKDAGIIFAADILPVVDGKKDKTFRLRLNLPQGWKAISAEAENKPGEYLVSDAGRAVFFVAKDAEISEKPFSGGSLRVVSKGEWHFSSKELSDAASEIFDSYVKLFGSSPGRDHVIFIAPFPQANVPPDTWEAETRGSSVVLVSADTGFKSRSLQRLHEQLRHEIFHLWLPNGINLTGGYDWFYEGAAVYQSLRTGVALNRLRFDDLLNTLSRAYSIDKAQRPRRTLIELSEQRHQVGDTAIYARGMLVMFMLDAEILSATRGKRSVESIYRDLFQKYREPERSAEAITAISDLIKTELPVTRVLKDAVMGSDIIDAARHFEMSGLEWTGSGNAGSLKIRTKLDSRQKVILDKLGYNNWRKMGRRK